MIKASFLFGAGAEISYGLPSGGKFALEIFKQDNTEAKQKFKKCREKIDKCGNYCGNWLPEDFDTKNISSYGKSVYETIIKGTLEHNRLRIIDKINCFDKIAEHVCQKSKDFGFDVQKYIENVIKKPMHTCNMTHSISFSEYISNGNKLFSSKWFSALLHMYKDKAKLSDRIALDLQRVLVSIMQLQLGALSEDFTRKFNESIFKKKDDKIDFLDDIGDFFRLNYHSAGLVGLGYIMEYKKPLEKTDEDLFEIFLFGILEDIYSSVLDYKTLIDSNWHYLYCPKDEWSKFCKICIFLMTVQAYIENAYKNNYDSQRKGYYNDLYDYKNKIEIKSIATTNYNVLIEDIIKEQVCHLNGSTDIYYDPYLNRVGTKEELNNVELHFIVPLLFTQSGTKPMTSINMSQRYVDVYKKFKESDCIFVVGFGFNNDDEHINDILRTLVDIDNKKIIIVDVNDTVTNDLIAEKLKVIKTENIIVQIVDSDRKVDGKNWLEKYIV